MRRGIQVASLLGCLALALPSAAAAARETYVVDNLTDAAGAVGCDTAIAGDCSLRQAVANANAHPNDADPAEYDRVHFAADLHGTITLNQPPAGNAIGVTETLEIVDHSFPRDIVVSGNDERQIFVSDAGTRFQVVGITLQNGLADNDGVSGDTGRGGAINAQGQLSLLQVSFSDNHATSGAAPDADALGGAVYMGATGLANLGFVSGSTFTGNSTVGSGTGSGGALYAVDRLAVGRSTIVDNSASGTDDPTGGGLEVQGSLADVTGTVIADNATIGSGASDPDIFAAATVGLGFSLIEDAGGTTFNNQGPNQFGIEPRLEPLAVTGGGIATRRPLPDSPLLDKGPPIMVPNPLDSRGLPGEVDLAAVSNAAGGNGGDIGAVELQLSELPATPSIPVGPPTLPTSIPASAVKKRPKCKKKRLAPKKRRACRRKRR